MTTKWPVVDGWVERHFVATHALDVPGGNPNPHKHEFTMRAGWRHEVQPFTGLAGSKALCDWDKSLSDVIAKAGDLTELCAPYPPTLEVTAMRLLDLLPGFYEWVELASYAPLYTVRVNRSGARLKW